MSRAGDAPIPPAPQAADFVAKGEVWSVHLSPDGESLAYLTELESGDDAIGIASLKDRKPRHYTIGALTKEVYMGAERVPVTHTAQPMLMPSATGGMKVVPVQTTVYAPRPIYVDRQIKQDAFSLAWRSANRLLVPLNTGFHTFDVQTGAMEAILNTVVPNKPNAPRFRRLALMPDRASGNGDVHFAGTLDGDNEGPDLWRYDTVAKQFETIAHNPGAIRQWFLASDPASAIGTGESDGVQQVYYRSSTTGEWAPALTLGAADGCRAIGYDAGRRLLYILRYDDDRNVVSSMDLEARSWTGGQIGFPLFDAIPWQGGPKIAGIDLCGAVFAPSDGRLVGWRTLNPKASTIWIDPTFADLQATINRTFPNLTNLVIESDAAGQRLLVLSFSGSEPGFFSIFETETGTLCRMMPVRIEPPDLPRASVFPVRFTAKDGAVLFGWITRPPAPVRPTRQPSLPLVVLIHPKPYEPWAGTYDDLAQFLASRGYVVLQLNHRGTQGRGRTFFEQGRAGLGAVVPDDLSAGVAELVARGYIDGSRVAVVGSGYGGHLALRALATGRFASGVAISPVVDWGAMARSGDTEMRRRWMKEAKVLDDRDDAGLLTAQSAVTFAKELKQPCLFIQGASQVAAPLTPVNDFVKRLKKAGGQAESLVIKNASDGIPEGKHRAEMFERIEAFLARTLGEKPVDSSPPAARKGS